MKAIHECCVHRLHAFRMCRQILRQHLECLNVERSRNRHEATVLTGHWRRRYDAGDLTLLKRL